MIIKLKDKETSGACGQFTLPAPTLPPPLPAGADKHFQATVFLCNGLAKYLIKFIQDNFIK